MNVGEPLLLVACERQPQPHKPSHSPYVLRCFRRGEGAGRNRNGQNEYAKRRSHLSFLFTLISLLIVVIKSRHSITQRFPIGIAVDIASSIRSPTNLKRINRTNLPRTKSAWDQKRLDEDRHKLDGYRQRRAAQLP